MERASRDPTFRPGERPDDSEPQAEEPSLPRLFRSLLSDAQLLVRHEITLAKVELKRSATRAAKESAIIAGGGALILLGLLVLLVFVILALGRLLDGRYWLSTVIVGAFLCVVGALFIVKGRRGLRGDRLKPAETIASLSQTRDWIEDETAEMKRELIAPQRERL